MSKIKKHYQIDVAAKAIADWRSMTIVHALYEHGPLRYKDLSESLAFSPTGLSQKLATLTSLGVIERRQDLGAKEVSYHVLPVAKKMVEAFHLLEVVEKNLQKKKKE